MKRGRRPTPIGLRLLRGNPGRRPLPEQRAQPRPGARCPSWLPQAAKAEWRRLAPAMERLGLLTEIDQDAFACYCVAWASFMQASERIEAEGMTTTAANGTEIPNPHVAIANAAMKQVRAFACEFGMTPASRASLAIPGPGNDDEETTRFFGPHPVAQPRRSPEPPRPKED